MYSYVLTHTSLLARNHFVTLETFSIMADYVYYSLSCLNSHFLLWILLLWGSLSYYSFLSIVLLYQIGGEVYAYAYDYTFAHDLCLNNIALEVGLVRFVLQA